VEWREAVIQGGDPIAAGGGAFDASVLLGGAALGGRGGHAPKPFWG
jgi:hypothetical protein